MSATYLERKCSAILDEEERYSKPPTPSEQRSERQQDWEMKPLELGRHSLIEVYSGIVLYNSKWCSEVRLNHMVCESARARNPLSRNCGKEEDILWLLHFPSHAVRDFAELAGRWSLPSSSTKSRILPKPTSAFREQVKRLEETGGDALCDTANEARQRGCTILAAAVCTRRRGLQESRLPLDDKISL
jgi:hypothetical protein